MNSDDSKTPPLKPDASGQKKIFDVTRPGKSPASPNSRNVIVGHKSPVKEDMFVPGPNTRLAGNPNEKYPLMDPDKKLAINPAEDTDAESQRSAVSVEVSEANSTLPTPVVAEGQVKPDEPETTAPTLPPKPAAEEPHQSEPAPTEEEPKLWEIESTAPTLDNSTPLPSEDTKDEHEEKPTPSRVALDQTVETPSSPSEPASTPSPVPLSELGSESTKPMSHDDVLAATDAPLLDHAVVSHHKHHTKWWEWVLMFVLIVAIALVALNFLLDAEVLTTDLSVPHTDLLR